MTDTQIRNIIQTHQERPVIKMAPDAVVYIDGLPYLINDYIGRGGVLVNFNDFIGSCSGAADVDTLIPAATINLSVPSDMKHLFQAPAGQRILKTMSEIKIFTKGYYLTDDGNSVYHRVFWGVVSNVNYADNRKTMEITVTAKGIMYLFDLMQLNLAPSAMNSRENGGDVTPYVTKDAALSPFQIILETFMTPLSSSVVDQDYILGNAIGFSGDKRTDKATFQRVYVEKWNIHLRHIHKSVRLFGLKDVDIEKVEKQEAPAADQGNPSQAKASQNGSTRNLHPDQVRQKIADETIMQKFTPDYRIGSIKLLQSTLVSRTTRVKELVDLMGWECYQDIDGSIVIKPPLYNLDCTNTKVAGADPMRNPFIINLHEVDGVETETEDEAQVRLTRMTVRGTPGTLLQDDAPAELCPHASFIDPNLVRQFGLRQEPPKMIPFIQDNSYMLYTYAASELTKVTRRWRTYSVTIPMRPELRLGFTIYMPHLDYFAYLENISWAYNRGSKVTMTLLGSSIRQRELFGKEQEYKETGPDGSPVTLKRWIYTSRPNLVYRWTKKPAAGVLAPDSANRLTDPTGTKGTDTSKAPEDKLTPEQAEQLARRKRNSGFLQTEPDTADMAWRIMDDVEKKFVNPVPVNKAYFDTISHSTMPYTDAKGYTLLRPFPWGRHITIEEALDVFTRPSSRRTGKILPFETSDSTGASAGGATASADAERKIDAFIMSGLGTPSANITDPTKGTVQDTQLYNVLKSVYDTVQDDTTFFVLAYSKQSDLTFAAQSNEEAVGLSLPEPGTKIDTKAEDRAKEFVAVVSSNSGTGEFYQ